MAFFVSQTLFPVAAYDLSATLDSGQSFRWKRQDDWWEGVVGNRWVQLRQADQHSILARTPGRIADWDWLQHYLQLNVDLGAVIATFPDDLPMRQAANACAGLRLLRQDPWECLISFILSSTKQIVQIRQIVALLCERFGLAVEVPPNHPPAFAFPTCEIVAKATEAELRGCKMGFRAPYVKQTAQCIFDQKLRLATLGALRVEDARAKLMTLPGVGRKIADCVLLFAYGFQTAFPVDVWVARALQQLYFPRRRVSHKRLLQFSASHFGVNAGYAQQYLFHYMRTQKAGFPSVVRTRPRARPPIPNTLLTARGSVS